MTLTPKIYEEMLELITPTVTSIQLDTLTVRAAKECNKAEAITSLHKILTYLDNNVETLIWENLG